MQQKILQLNGNSAKYKSLLCNARKIINKHYPKTPLLTNDDYSPSTNPQVKTIESTSNLFNILLKAFFNNFSPKTPLLKNDPYEEGIDFDYSEKGVEEQNEEKNDDISVKLRTNTMSELYDLYLDADKKMKKDGYEIVPPFFIKESENQVVAGGFSNYTVGLYFNNNKSLRQMKGSILVKNYIDRSFLAELKYIPDELKQKIKNLSPQDKAKFINFFDKYVVMHEMQHYKQFVTMLKVYGIEETKHIIISASENLKTKIIDQIYEAVLSEKPLPTMKNQEKLEKIKQNYQNVILRDINRLKDFDIDGTKADEYKYLSNIIIEKFNEIKNSENVQEVQSGISYILERLDALEEFKGDFKWKFACPMFDSVTQALKLIFNEIRKKNTTVQKYIESKIKENFSELEKGCGINEEQYQKIYDSIKEQPITEEERQKAEIYKNANLEYTPLMINQDAYYSNPLEIEAYTVQAQATLEKIEEYNERHKKDKQS